MSIALPPFTSGDIAFGGVRLPAFTSGDIAFGGVRLPAFTSGDIAFGGVRLPAFATAEGIPSALYVSPEGGIVLGGDAYIVGDPSIIPTGGVSLGGAAVVAAVYVMIYAHYPLGGMALSGAAPSSASWTRYVPTGGMALSGAAPSSALWTQHVPTGGVVLSGTAAFSANGGAAIADGVGLGDSVSVRVVHRVSLADGLAVGDAVGAVKHVSIMFTETVGMSEATQARAVYAVLADESLSLSDAARVNGILAAYVYNVTNTAVSTYKGYNFNSFALVGGKYYGADLDGGVYELTGADDNGTPIEAVITLPTDDLSQRAQNGIVGTGELKRCEVAYLGYTANGDMFLRVDANGNSNVYSISPNATPGLRTGRIILGKGVSSRYWDFTLGNLLGADFEIESITFIPTVLSRRITEH